MGFNSGLKGLNSSNVTELKNGGKQSCKTTSKWKSRVMRKRLSLNGE
jgi:hypothetical protein